MSKLGKVGVSCYVAEPFQCGFDGKLFAGNLCNAMLNSADHHSNDRGLGMHYLASINRTWVLSRFSMFFKKMPKSYDYFKIETWIENAMKYFTLRNFAVYDDHGEAIGYGRSIWALIDTQTRTPSDILSVKDGLITEYIDSEKKCLVDKPSRVVVSEKAKLVREMEMFFSDIDINGHVNSMKYLEHVLNLWDNGWYSKHHIKGAELAYVSEAHQGDCLRFYKEDVSQYESLVRITKKVDDGNSELEVCRCKVKFDDNVGINADEE